MGYDWLGSYSTVGVDQNSLDLEVAIHQFAGSMMTRFVKVAEVADFAVKKSKRVTIENVDIALFAVGEQFHAVQNDCPHQHYSAMHEGMLHEGQITCPMHGWTFDLATGKATVGGGRLRIYAVKIIGNEIHIEAPSGEQDWAKQ